MGLSFTETGKYTSERHETAKQDGKLTAGQAAQIISKATKTKVFAKDIKPYATEWHHSGFYSNGNGNTMGRTYFFTNKQVEDLVANWKSLLVEKIAKEAETKKEIALQKRRKRHGFYWVWETDYKGNFGKKRTYKVLHFYSGNEYRKPKHNFTKLNKSEYKKLAQFEGATFIGWDEPTKNELKDWATR